VREGGVRGVAGVQELQEFRSSGVQEFRSSGVQEFRVGEPENCKHRSSSATESPD
jgi:hypothetical protein